MKSGSRTSWTPERERALLKLGKVADKFGSEKKRDCHAGAGAGAVVGFTMKMNDYIIPNVIGVDIDSAALSKIENGKKDLDPQKLEILSKEFNIDFNELKQSYFGEKIAMELYTHKCPMETLRVAEKKYKYFTQKEEI